MNKPRKPQKAPSGGASLDEIRMMRFPIYGSPKIDGYRCLVCDGVAYTSAMKPITNRYIQTALGTGEYDGLEGELVVGHPRKMFPEDDVFNRTTGAVRRADGAPDFAFWVFDSFLEDSVAFGLRMAAREPQIRQLAFARLVPQSLLYGMDQVRAFGDAMLDDGYEGAMLRDPHAPYYDKRVTVKSGVILKFKPLEQDEAVVVDVYEQRENQNEAFTSELGRTKRSTHAENMVGKDTLGGFVLKSPRWKDTFRCGTIIGGTLEYRQRIWDDPALAIGKTVTYLYQGYGSIDKPRQPRCKAEFRDPADMSD